MRARVLGVTLALSGLVAIGVGAAALLAPVAFFASNGVDLGESASLRSEVRAAGGVNLALGALMLAGVVVRDLRLASASLATTFYAAYGGSRLLGIALDGVPSEGLVIAAAVELALASLGLAALVHTRAEHRADARRRSTASRS